MSSRHFASNESGMASQILILLIFSFPDHSCVYCIEGKCIIYKEQFCQISGLLDYFIGGSGISYYARTTENMLNFEVLCLQKLRETIFPENRSFSSPIFLICKGKYYKIFLPSLQLKDCSVASHTSEIHQS